MRGTVRVYTLHIYGITHEGYGQGSYVPYIGDIYGCECCGQGSHIPYIYNMHMRATVRVQIFHIYGIYM